MDFLQYLEYKDGSLYWKVDVNKRYAKKGMEAGRLRPDGYRTITLHGKKYLAHRLIYFMHYNEWPEIVDHIDRDKNNNKIENLRGVDPYGSSLNRSTTKKEYNINFHHNRFQVIVKGKYIGRFKTIEEAKLARDACKGGVCGI